MSPQSDLTYYTARAADERRLSESCANPRVARVHRQLAERYEALLVELRGGPPELEIVTSGRSRAA